MFTKHRKEVKWLEEYDSTSTKIALFNAVQAFKNFFNKICKFPRYKSRKVIQQTFPVRPERTSILKNYIQFPGKIGCIKCGKIPNNYLIGTGNKGVKLNIPHRHFYDTRILFDGCNYWLSLRMIKSENVELFSVTRRKYKEKTQQSGVIGIDVGFKGNNWIVDSNETIVQLPDFSKERKKIKKLSKKLNRQIRIASRTKMQIRSKRRLKTIKEMNKYHKKITNKRLSAIYDYISHNIIDNNPAKVIIEDINTTEMLCKDKNIPLQDREKYNSKIYDAGLCKFQEILTYKCKHHGIELIKADKYYPSSQICSNCGNRHPIGSRRIYRCPICGMVKNRDINAAITLSKYFEPIVFK